MNRLHTEATAGASFARSERDRAREDSENRSASRLCRHLQQLSDEAQAVYSETGMSPRQLVGLLEAKKVEWQRTADERDELRIRLEKGARS